MKYLSWIPAAIIMVMIFVFSSKPAYDSNESSMIIVTQIVQVYENVTNAQYTPDTLDKLESTLNHIVRKSAHFCEYALLAAAAAFHLFVWKRRGKQLFYLPIIIASLYSMTDEYHQTFIPGRAGAIRDVLLDTLGAATGSLIFTLIVLYLIYRKSKVKTSATPLV